MPPSYGPLKQWLNGNVNGNFCVSTPIFFSERGIMSLKTNVLGPFRESCGNGPGTLKFCSDILNSWDFGGAQTKYLYMYNLDIRIIEKNWVLFSQKNSFSSKFQYSRSISTTLCCTWKKIGVHFLPVFAITITI